MRRPTTRKKRSVTELPTGLTKNEMYKHMLPCLEAGEVTIGRARLAYLEVRSSSCKEAMDIFQHVGTPFEFTQEQFTEQFHSTFDFLFQWGTMLGTDPIACPSLHISGEGWSEASWFWIKVPMSDMFFDMADKSGYVCVRDIHTRKFIITDFTKEAKMAYVSAVFANNCLPQKL